MNVRLYERKGIWWASWTAKGQTVRHSTRARSESEARVVVDSWGVLPAARSFTFDTWGVVYFIEATGAARIKIGWTRPDGLERRVSTLQVGSPFPLKVLATYAGMHFHEHQEHRVFRDDWIHGEWFHHSARLATRIQSLNSPAP